MFDDNFNPNHRVQSFYTDIQDFHVKFELHYDGKSRELEPDMGLFRIGFMIEELAEYTANSGYPNLARALNEIHEHVKNGERWMLKRNEGGRNLEQQFDGLIDLTYVALGTAYLHGFQFDEGWKRVHAANMSKVRVENVQDSTRKSKFDVVKPKGWVPPTLSDLLE